MTAFLANANTKTTYLKSGTHHPPGGQKYMGWFFYEKQSPLLSRRVGVVTLIDTKVHFDSILSDELGPFVRTCNPSKWEADIWGWLEVRRSAMIHYTVNQRPPGLGLLTVWSLWGNPGMARCQEMSTLPAGYIPQCKLTSASSSGSLDFIVCKVL